MNIEQLQNLPDAEKAKLFAARHAFNAVNPRMNIGLGTGSTAVWLVRLLARAKADGLNFCACATSSATEKLAESLGIKIQPLGEVTPLYLAIDGADEFDSDNNLIKGGGGALLREKIVAHAAERFIVITDASKEVKTLGKFSLPVAVVKFGWRSTGSNILEVLLDRGIIPKHCNHKVEIRLDGDKAFITDEGHCILDLHLDSIADAPALHNDLKAIVGVVETGLFLNMANEVVMADSTGLVKSRETGGDWKETRYELAELADMLPRD